MMIDSKECKILKTFQKTNDKCTQIICLDKKPIVLFKGKVYLNVFDYSKLKNINKIPLNTQNLLFYSNTNCFIQRESSFFTFYNCVKNKNKYMSFRQPCSEKHSYMDESFNCNFYSYLTNQGNIGY